MLAVLFDFNRTLYNPDTDALNEYARELLSHLQQRGIPLFMVCKGGEERKKKIEELGLLPFFQRVIVTERKGLVDFFSCRSEYPDAQWIAIGDRLVEELRYAKEAGMETVWFRNGRFAHEQPAQTGIHPGYVVFNLTEVPSLPCFADTSHSLDGSTYMSSTLSTYSQSASVDSGSV